uniref:insulin-like growth factor-binding protein 5 n=1 Tax=Ciona intestinalis TaxID=7719 RepID=UPI000EF446D7|nr:insulin-like growth factor-binding protein 5 [Ciona intestinalis]|eukprot:XP_026694482.1 insulin-like growth factor-binding protein 5 [Ciona intestinalis]
MLTIYFSDIFRKKSNNTMKFLFSLVSVLLFANGICIITSQAFDTQKCHPCTAEDLNSCPVLEESATCELVVEPNCGCCMMCAKLEGQSCGVAEGYCADGLLCGPADFDNYDAYGYLQNFVCMTEAAFDRVYDAVVNNPLIPESPTQGEEDSIHVSTPPPAPESTTIPDEPQDEGPCQRHWDMVISKTFFDRHEWVPECTLHGYYSPLQCEVAFGLVRGRCWCVDRLGNAVSDYMADDAMARC